METNTNNVLLLYSMYMSMHTHKWSHKGTSKYTHSGFYRYYLTSNREKLLCSSLVTHNTSTTTELKKSNTYSSVLYTVFQLSLFIAIWTHTYKHTHKHTHTHCQKCTVLTDPQWYSTNYIPMIYSLLKMQFRLKITLLNDSNSFGSVIFFSSCTPKT